jgi:hypothetical protein
VRVRGNAQGMGKAFKPDDHGVDTASNCPPLTHDDAMTAVGPRRVEVDRLGQRGVIEVRTSDNDALAKCRIFGFAACSTAVKAFGNLAKLGTFEVVIRDGAIWLVD